MVLHEYFELEKLTTRHRIPHYSNKDLTAWYQSGKPRHLNRLLNYFVLRVQLDLDILDTNELVVRTR